MGRGSGSSAVAAGRAGSRPRAPSSREMTAESVQAAADSATDRMGDIVMLDRVRERFPGLSDQEFATKLWDMHRAGEIVLARADMSSETADYFTPSRMAASSLIIGEGSRPRMDPGGLRRPSGRGAAFSMGDMAEFQVIYTGAKAKQKQKQKRKRK
jgi:hypothetical protein